MPYVYTPPHGWKAITDPRFPPLFRPRRRRRQLIHPQTVTTTDVRGLNNEQLPTPFDLLPPMSIRSGKEFAANSWVNTKLADNAAIDANSATYVSNFVAMLNANQSGAGAILNRIPIYIVGPNQATSRVMWDGFLGPPASTYLINVMGDVPLPDPDNFITSLLYGQDDSNAVIYQPSTGKYWDFWNLLKSGRKTTDSKGYVVDQWQCSFGGYITNLSTNPGWFVRDHATTIIPGASATGIPLLAHMMTYNDLLIGQCNHPVGVSLGIAQSKGPEFNTPPAQRSDAGSGTIQEGLVFRLPHNINLENFTATAWDGISPKTTWRLYAEAMRDYGCVTYDIGGTSVAWLQSWDPLNWPHSTVFGPGDPYIDGPVSDGRFVPFTILITDFPWSQMQLLQTNLVTSVP